MHNPCEELAKAGAWEALLLAVDSAGDKKATSAQGSPRASLLAGATSRAASAPVQHTALKRNGKPGLRTAFKRLPQKQPSCWQRVARVPLAERAASPQPHLATPCRSGELTLGARRQSGELLPCAPGTGMLETCALAARLDALLQQRAAFWQQMETAPDAHFTVRCAASARQQPSSRLGQSALQPAAVLEAVLGHVSEEDVGPLLAARRFLAQF